MAYTGIRRGAKLMLLPVPSAAEITNIRSVPDQRIRGFDDEVHAAMRRRQSHAMATSLPSGVELASWPLQNAHVRLFGIAC